MMCCGLAQGGCIFAFEMLEKFHFFDYFCVFARNSSADV